MTEKRKREEEKEERKGKGEMRGVVERRALTAMLVRARISSLHHHRQSHAFSSSSSSPGGIGRGRGRGRGAPPDLPPSGIGHGTVIRERTAAAPAPSPQFGGLGRGVGGVRAAVDLSRVAPKASEGFEGVNSKNVDRFDSYYSQQQQQQSYSNNYGRNESNAAFGRPSGLEDPPSANRGFSDGPEGEFPVYGRQHQNLRNPSVDPQISNEGYYGRPYQNERSAFVDPRTTNEGYYGRQYENEPIRSVDPRIVNQRQYEYERYSFADPRLANEGYSGRQYQNERYPPVDPRISSEAYYSRQYQNERYPPVDPRTSSEEYYSRQYQSDRYSSADPRAASEEYHRRPYQNGRYPLVDPRIPKEDYYGRPYQNERYPAVDPRTTNEGYYGRQYESGPPLPFDVRQANERFYDRGYQSEWNPSADPRRANEGYASSRQDNISYEQSGYIPSRRLGGSVPPGVEREQNVRVPEPSGQSPGVYRQPGSVDAVQSQWYGRDSGRPVRSTEAFREETFNRSEQDFAMRRPPIEPADPSQYYNAGPPYSRRVNEDSKSAEYARDETIRMRDTRISRSEAGNLGPAPPQFTTRDHYLASGRDAHGLPDERGSFVGMGRGQGPVAGPAGLHARVSGPTSQNLSQQSFPPHLGSGRGAAGRFPREDDIGNMAQPGMGQMTGRFKDTQVDPNSHNPNYYAQTDRHPPFQPRTYDAEQLYSYNMSEAEVRQGEKSGTSVRILPTREREQAAERYDRRSIQEEAKQREWSGRAISPQSGSSVRGARTSEYLKAEEFSRKERDPGNIQAPRHADAHQAQTFGRDSSWTQEGSQLPADSSVTAVKDKAHAREQDRRVSQIGSEPAKYVSSKPSERSSSIKSAETGVQVKVSSEPARYVSPISQPLKHLPSINKDSVRSEPSVSAEGASGNVASTTLSLKPSKPGPGILEVGANDSGAILDTTSKLPFSHFHPKPAEFLYPASTTSMERAVVQSEFRVATQKTESTILQSTSEPGGTDPVQDIHTPLETTGLAEQRSPAETEFRSSEAVKPDLYPHHLELQGLISKPGFGRGKPVEKARFQDRSTWKLGDMPLDVGKSSPVSDTHVVNLSSPDGALAGMGRGKPPSPAQPTTSQQEPKQPHHLQLSREEAAQRALSILEEGIEKTLSEEQRERRRKKFSRPEFSGQSLKASAATSTEHLPISKKSKEGRLRPERQREKAVRTAEEEDESVEEELTPEQQEVINVIHNTEDIIKSSLHGRFLVDFEPEYAMEEFGRNPDIEEKPFPSLEETLEQAKHLLMPLEGLTEEKDWQDAVQKVMSNASHLEKLVEAYSGPARVTARQQNIELESIAESLPAYIAPEMKAFTERALITLQNNPGWNLHQKKNMLNRIVSNFASI